MFEESVSFIPSIWASVNSWFTPTVLFVFLNLMIGTIAITSSLASNQKKNQQQQYQEQQQQQFARSPSVLQRLKSINFYNYRSPEPNTNYAQTQGTDAHFTHHFKTQQERETERDQEHQQHQWNRSPSMLQRLKSINLYNYMSQESNPLDKNQEEETQSFPNQVHAEEHHQQAGKENEQEQEREKWKEEEGEGEGEGEENHIQDQEQTLDEIYGQLQQGSNVTRTQSDTKPAPGEMPKKFPKKMRKSASSKSASYHFREEDIAQVEARRPATVKELGNTKMAQVDDEGVDAKADDFINKFKHQLKLQRIDSIIRYKEMINRGAEK